MTLTDSYVEAALRRLPARRRPDIERELRTSIADAIDDKLHAGTGPAEAERAVLTELGDPARLAAGYADRPLHLIGPAFYPEYTRLLTALIATVLPAVAVAVAAFQIVDGVAVSAVLGRAVGTTITVAVHLAFWTTLAFAAIERTSAIPSRNWTVADLPGPSTPRSRRAELVAGAVFLGLFITFVLLSPAISTERDAAGEPIGPLSPWLWDSGLVYVFVAFAVAGYGFAVAERHLRWSAPLAVVRAVVDLACPVILVVLALTERILNPAFVTAAGWPPESVRWTAAAVGVIGALNAVRALLELVAGLARRTWMTPNWGALVRAAADGVAQLPRRRSAGT